jgi:hypothetical protein
MKPVCNDTHRFLRSGMCPWCHQPVVNGQLKADMPPRAVAVCRWNVPAMLEALERDGTQTRLMVVTNLGRACPQTEEALPVLSKALTNSEGKVRWMATSMLSQLGSRLSDADAQVFENALRARPDELAIRILLLRYHWHRANLFESSRQAHQRHALWVIEHAPNSAIAGHAETALDPVSHGEVYERGKQLWLEHITANRENVAILGNAAEYFIHFDRTLSEGCLKKAQALEPDNPDWSRRLGFLYRLGFQSRSGADRQATATKALAELERGVRNAGELERFRELPDLARAAFEAGQWDKARAYATELLQAATLPDYFHSQDGDAAHYGNFVLGRLALRSGDVETAKHHLLESGRTQGSPVLCSFGPSMTLAKELLERGEQDTVIEYLRLCTNFWETDDHQAEQWIYAIEHGDVPDFGANLNY